MSFRWITVKHGVVILLRDPLLAFFGLQSPDPGKQAQNFSFMAVVSVLPAANTRLHSYVAWLESNETGHWPAARCNNHVFFCSLP
jgi:hypothetical protein